MTSLLSKVSELCLKLNETNKSNAKKEILKNLCENDKELQKVLTYTYDTTIVFGVTSKSYLKFESNPKKAKTNILTQYRCIFKLLDDFQSRKATGDKALLFLYHFVRRNKEHKDVILKILDKNLKVRLNAKAITKVFPDLFSVFSCALANTFTEKKMKGDDWYISRKLDGVRCLTFINPDTKEVKFLSRQNKEFLTLGVVKQDILDNIDSFDGPTVLDGELCLLDKNGNESYTDVMKQIKRKNHSIANPMYLTFDIMSVEEFWKTTTESILSTRIEQLQNTIKGFSTIRVLEQVEYTKEIFDEMVIESGEKDWEGLMLRKNICYEGKRSNNRLKVKKMLDEEFVVKKVLYNKMRFINQDTGLEEEINALSAILIDYHDTKVGSGFTLENRKHYGAHPEEIEGMTVTIQFFERTEDKNGNKSLRFPVFKINHGMKRDT